MLLACAEIDSVDLKQQVTVFQPSALRGTAFQDMTDEDWIVF